MDAPDIAVALQERGYATTAGSFGQPLIVPKTDGFVQLKLENKIPDCAEQEIVIADLVGPEPIKASDNSFEKAVPGLTGIWTPTSIGLIDPRPAIMRHTLATMNRIHEHGGIFIVFSGAHFEPGSFMSEQNEYGMLSTPYGDRELRGLSNWGILSEIYRLQVKNDYGREMKPTELSSEIGIASYFDTGSFQCVIDSAMWDPSQRFNSLATNKYGDPVAALIRPRGDDQAGLIFVLPQVEQRAALVTELLENALPTLAPQLFPHSDRSSWTLRPEYELPNITAVKDEIAKVKEAARARVYELEAQIDSEREQYGFLHDLVTATGDDLVRAVIHALRMLGFNDVRDVDAEAEAAGESGPRREDVRIMDAAVPILVEVKGIAGSPKEASSLQVVKYIAPRMREWGRTDIHALAIVNHQRNIPALDREHDHVFQEDVVTNAEDQNLSLLTGWDLFRLSRGFIVHQWRHEDVADLFVTPGRIHPVPIHYSPVGSVDGYWPKASVIGLRLSGQLKVGDRIAYALPVDYIEETVTSLQINDQAIEIAETGQHAGTKTSLDKSQARKGVQVYLVTR